MTVEEKATVQALVDKVNELTTNNTFFTANAGAMFDMTFDAEEWREQAIQATREVTLLLEGE